MTARPLAPPRVSRWRVFGSILWALIPLLTVGFLTPLAFAIAWIRRPGFGSFFSFVVYFGLIIWSVAANGGPNEDIGTAVQVLVVWLFATVHAFVVRPRTWYPDSALESALRPWTARDDESETLHGEILDPRPEAASPPPSEPEPPAPEPDQTEAHDSADESDPDEPMLGREQDEPVIALAAMRLLEAGDEALVPLARFEQRFFGNFRPHREELLRFADRGSARIEGMFDTDPVEAAVACDRAETILAELGAEWLNFDLEESEADADEGPGPDRPEAPAQPEQEPPAEPSAFGEPTLGERVCESATYRHHVQGLRRFPDSSVVTAIIDTAHDAGGVLATAEVARIAGRHPASVDGYVAQLQRALNLDGTQVLSKQDNGSSIRLDRELLRQQFLGGSR